MHFHADALCGLTEAHRHKEERQAQTDGKRALPSLPYECDTHAKTHINVLNVLTWHSVDGFERPEDPHRPDGRQVDVLQVQ